ncbi:hypothetical protein KUCAC02_032894, partial [Chaenocephalus aceratus]
MDSEVVKQLMDFMIHNIYPDGLNRTQRFIIKRRAETFRIIDGELHYCTYAGGKNNVQSTSPKSWCQPKKPTISLRNSTIATLADILEGKRQAIISKILLAWHGGGYPQVGSSVSPVPVKEGLYQREGRVHSYRGNRASGACRDGPSGLLTDQGGEFCNKVNDNLCEKLGIKRSLCSPSLNKLVAGQPKQWDQVLQGTMFALRTKPQLTTKFSPYYLMFGREARYPSEVPEKYEITEDKVCSMVEREEISEGLKRQGGRFHEVNANVKKKSTTSNPRHMGREEEGDAVGQVWPIQGLQRKSFDLGKELEGEIVNAYLSWIGAKAGVYIFDSYLMTSLWQGTHKGGLRKLDLTKHEVAAGAVCDGAHWTLIIMYLNENRSLFLDPFGATEKQLSRCKDLTRSLVRNKRPSVGRWACTTITHPIQQDSTSCGVFICKLAEQILLKKKVQYPVDLEGVASMRFQMAMALVKNSDALSQLCRACGEFNSGPKGDQWNDVVTVQTQGGGRDGEKETQELQNDVVTVQTQGGGRGSEKETQELQPLREKYSQDLTDQFE